MAQEPRSKLPPDVRPLLRLIRRASLLLRSSWVVSGSCTTLGLLLGLVTGMVALDMALTLPPALRLVALALIVVPVLSALLAFVVRPLLRRLSLAQVAGLIETRLPGIHNRLVSCIALADNPKAAERSPAFHSRLIEEAQGQTRSFRPAVLIDYAKLRRSAALAGLACLAFVVLGVAVSDRLPAALARICWPFADIPPVGSVRLTVTPGDATVLRSEDVIITASVAEGYAGKMWVKLEAAGATSLQYDLVRDSGARSTWKVALSTSHMGEGFESGFRYRVYGGGTWSREHRITIVDRPRIAGYHTVVHHPEYMALPPKRGVAQTLRVSGPEGGEVEVVVEVEGDVSTGEVQLLAPGEPSHPVPDWPERRWFGDQLPVTDQVWGTWQWEKDRLGRTSHTEPAADGPRGHWFETAGQGFTLQPGEQLYTWVYLPSERRPRTLLVEWHDGRTWHHGAWWGESWEKDRTAVLAWGQPAFPGRHRAGDLPPTGEWVRLEVRAARVALEGQTLHGMAFKVRGGQAHWHAAGALPPVLNVVQTWPMRRLDSTQWSGRFPLHGSGFYRPELRGSHGHTNLPLQADRFEAVPDQPPHVLLERPGTDLVLSQPVPVPLTIHAADDFGLADVAIVLHPGTARESEQPVQRYERPVERASVEATLDPTAAAGGILRYLAQARDRKGQTARSPVFTIRMAVGPNAADRKLAVYERTQEGLLRKFEKLLADQAKVRNALATIAPPAAGEAAAPGSKAALDPKRGEVRKQLGQLGRQEQQNAIGGQQLAGELNKAVTEASKTGLAPPSRGEQLRSAEQQLKRVVVPAMKDLSGRMNQAAGPGSPAPDVSNLQARSQALQQELEKLGAVLTPSQRQPGANPAGSSAPSVGNLQGTRAQPTPVDADIPRLDPAAWAAVLRLPHRLREEVLQGMRETGPEGYRTLIDGYYKRLSEVKRPRAP